MYWGSEYKKNFCIFHSEWYIPFNISVNLNFSEKLYLISIFLTFKSVKEGYFWSQFPENFSKRKDGL